MTVDNGRPVAYRDVVERAARARSTRYYKLAVFGTAKSAATIAWMIRNGKGLRAFREYEPGTFDAEVRNGTEVWFRRV